VFYLFMTWSDLSPASRSSELLVALGGDLVYGIIQENGATFVTGVLKDQEGMSHPSMMTVHSADKL
jgi:hypothetical protein